LKSNQSALKTTTKDDAKTIKHLQQVNIALRTRHDYLSDRISQLKALLRKHAPGQLKKLEEDFAASQRLMTSIRFGLSESQRTEDGAAAKSIKDKGVKDKGATPSRKESIVAAIAPWLSVSKAPSKDVSPAVSAAEMSSPNSPRRRLRGEGSGGGVGGLGPAGSGVSDRVGGGGGVGGAVDGALGGEGSDRFDGNGNAHLPRRPEGPISSALLNLGRVFSRGSK
jgi:hypothetical protein